VELPVSDLARESSADPQHRYESTGAKEIAERIKLDNGDSYKGRLHYRAEFIPALNLKHVDFDACENEIQRVAHEAQRSSSSSSSSFADEEEPFVTVTRPTTEAQTNGHQTGSKESIRTDGDKDASMPAEDSVQGIELSKEELFKHRE